MLDYKTDLNQRYWAYQASRFPDWPRYFDLPNVHDGRPPVFLVRKASQNVILDPHASQQEIDKLLALLPVSERHRWFRSMNSSQALAHSVLGNLTVQSCWRHLADLTDDDDNALFGPAHISSDNFAMEFKINYLAEPRPTSLDGYFSGPYRIAIECKFTEAEVGTCSRPRLTPKNSNYLSEHCDGTYSHYLATKDALREQNMLRKCSWQRLVQHAKRKNVLSWLTDELAIKYGL